MIIDLFDLSEAAGNRVKNELPRILGFKIIRNKTIGTKMPSSNSLNVLIIFLMSAAFAVSVSNYLLLSHDLRNIKIKRLPIV